MLTRSTQLEIFEAQTRNVRELSRAWIAVQRTINACLKRNDLPNASLHTKIQALILCAWAEATFSKLVHTPHGFNLDEISQINAVAQEQGIKDAWIKCLRLGLRKIVASPKSNYIPNVRQRVTKMIGIYVGDFAIIRNKIAHGEWVTALNSRRTAVNLEISRVIQGLDTVQLGRVKCGWEALCTIVESLIESPSRTFHQDYWQILADSEAKLESMKSWTLDAKAKLLQDKDSHYRSQVEGGARRSIT
jgi:hypothetical protein